jgi:hypothetical protein
MINLSPEINNQMLTSEESFRDLIDPDMVIIYLDPWASLFEEYLILRSYIKSIL